MLNAATQWIVLLIIVGIAGVAIWAVNKYLLGNQPAAMALTAFGLLFLALNIPYLVLDPEIWRRRNPDEKAYGCTDEERTQKTQCAEEY